MKNILFCSALILAVMPATAAEYTTLTLVGSDGTEYTLPASGLEFTVTGGVLNAVSSSGTISLKIDQLVKMYFGGNASVDAVPADYEGPVTLFKPDGTSAGNFTSVDEARATLPAGIYIVMANGKVYKMAVK